MAKERDLSSLRGQFEAVRVEKEALEKSLTSGQADLAGRLATLEAERAGLAESEKKLKAKIEYVQTDLEKKEEENDKLRKGFSEVRAKRGDAKIIRIALPFLESCPTDRKCLTFLATLFANRIIYAPVFIVFPLQFAG